ncbi:hypothetical protein N7456_006381 [Penicillium angulare]|uniref:Uncharacterized protein n=1 Tax=Penicillium angulare TaxID=116970 RepID=A0A9W9FHN8_9EURO|nr:hypothetical protein N7456_006381 [Penicillium angulare]
MSSTFARCCANSHSDCGFATSCTDGSTILKGDGGTSLCTSGQNCAFMTIYDYATTDTPYLDIFCWEDWPDSASQIFRTTAITTSSGTVLQTSTNPATPGASPTTHVPAATTSASAADKKLQKKSWITEAVIGAVAGCLVFGGLCFWLAWRWRGKRGHDGRAEAHKSTNSETWNGQIIHSQNLLLPRELPANPKIALIELYAPPPPPR